MTINNLKLLEKDVKMFCNLKSRVLSFLRSRYENDDQCLRLQFKKKPLMDLLIIKESHCIECL